MLENFLRGLAGPFFLKHPPYLSDLPKFHTSKIFPPHTKTVPYQEACQDDEIVLLSSCLKRKVDIARKMVVCWRQVDRLFFSSP